MDTLIGPRIKQFRQKAELTKEKLAQLADISYTALTKIESGVIKSPSVQTIYRIAKALKISMEQIVEGDQ